MKRTGIVFALLAYTAWGLFPAFWKLLHGVPHGLLLAHRIVWSSLFFTGLLAWRHGAGASRLVEEALAHWKSLAASATLLAVNWFIYIYAVNSGLVLEASLGYFIAPLVNVGLGLVVLGERLSPLRWVAMAAAVAGVALLALQGQGFPVIAVSLAGTWGVYGLVRKRTPVQPLAASTLESAFLVLPALVSIPAASVLAPEATSMTALQGVLVVVSGAITALPLLWFAEAARRLPLSTMGFFQYITPSLQFLLAVFAYGEPFTAVHGRSFGLIWAGLALFVLDAVAVDPKRKACDHLSSHEKLPRAPAPHQGLQVAHGRR